MPLESPVTVRARALKNASSECFDLIVIGGGIHGASAAREAAARGMKVLLLEAKDYAFGISSRSSKMLHGGIRYLENWDVALVHEALRERDYFIHAAGHLARAQDFFVPVIAGQTRPAWQLKIGLQLYDTLAHGLAAWTGAAKHSFFPTHSRVSMVSQQAQQLREMGLGFSGLFRYFDGQMDDARYVIESVLDSIELGATCLNHAPVSAISLDESSDARWRVRWESEPSAAQYESRGRALLNFAGPWVPAVDALIGEWDQDWPQAVYSRGIHLLFDVDWPTAGLILPTGVPGRYYFVWPYFSAGGRGTLVGTTDQRVETSEADPVANEAERDELLQYLKRDLPESGLNQQTLYASFCGTRILASKGRSKNVSAVSREEVFLKRPYYRALLGGKYTTARVTASKAVLEIAAELGFALSGGSNPTDSRQLPGGAGWSEQSYQELLKRVGAAFEHDSLTEAAVRRFGMRAEHLLDPMVTDGETAASAADKRALREEIRLAIVEEQALSVDDVLRRRLGLRLLPGERPGEEALVERELAQLTANIA